MLAKTPTLMDDQEYRELALRHAAEADERTGPFDAELIPEVAGRWHILTVQPNHEASAAAYLISRRFGVFLPQYYSVYVTRGRKREAMRNLFPGYLFVFVWDVERHARRILSVPGVNGFVAGKSGPVVVPDRLIDRARAIENQYQRPLTYMDDVIMRRRRRKKYSQSVVRKEVQVAPEEIVSMTAYDAFADIEALEDHERIGKLHVALGLAS